MPKKVLAQVSILADNVAHVRSVPEGVPVDEIVQKFWVERAAKIKEAPVDKALASAKMARAKQGVNALDLLKIEE